jgi:hypothetical protein
LRLLDEIAVNDPLVHRIEGDAAIRIGIILEKCRQPSHLMTAGRVSFDHMQQERLPVDPLSQLESISDGRL